MTDFLQELERELVRAARRRSTVLPSRSSRLQRWAERRLADLRDIASGGLAVASVGLVVVVLAFMMAPRAHRTASERGAGSATRSAPSASASSTCAEVDASRSGSWAPAHSAPGGGLRRLLGAAAPVTGRARETALRDLDQTVAQATSVYVRDIKVVRFPDGARVTLIPAQACATVGLAASQPTRPRAALLAEVASVHGVATIPLGTVAQIRSGAVFRSQALMLRTARGLAAVTMVPPGVVRVVCHLGGSSTEVRRFPAVDHLVLMTGVPASSRCHLV